MGGDRTSMDVVAWLLDGDPAIRWQVLRDLTDAHDDAVAAERARVAGEGRGGQVLALRPHGGPGGGSGSPSSARMASGMEASPRLPPLPPRTGGNHCHRRGKAPSSPSGPPRPGAWHCCGLSVLILPARRRVGRFAWSARTADGSTTASPTSRARLSHASTVGPLPSERISARTLRASWTGSLVSR